MPALLGLRSDASLVRGAIHGKPRALESLVLRYQRKAYAIARAIARDPDVADDIVQEAFLLAIQNLPTLRVHGSFCPWFLEIVRNVARKSRRREPVLFTPAPEPRPVEDLDALEVRELRQRVWAEVEKLPESLREAVFLYYHEGRSVREVARALEISVAAAKKRLQSGREHLSERLWRALEDTLRDLVPSAREWRRTGRRLALVTIAALSSTRPAAALGAATAAGATASSGAALAAGGAKVMAGIGTLGGIILMKKTFLGAAVAAVLITGGIAVLSTVNSGPGDREATSLEPESVASTAAEERLAREVEERERDLARLEEENRRLREAVARPGADAAQPVVETATVGIGSPAAADTTASTEGSGIDWSKLSKLIAENIGLMIKARESAEAGEFTAEEQALMMRISSEFMIVSAQALKRSAHPIFDPVIFDELAQAVFRESLGLSQEQSARLTAANAQILNELLGDTDPGELVPIERYRMREGATAALKDAIEGILDPTQLAAWESIQDLGDFVFEGPLATRELGLDVPNVVAEVGRSWIKTFHLTDEEARALGPLAIEYVDLARQTLERYANDEAAFDTLSAEQRARLDQELYELQRRYDERIEQTLDDERFEAYRKGVPTLLRFRFGNGASMSQKSGVF